MIYQGRHVTSKSGREWYIRYELTDGPTPGTGRKGTKRLKSGRDPEATEGYGPKRKRKKKASSKARRKKSATRSRSARKGRQALPAKRAPLLLMAVSTVPREKAPKARGKSTRASRSGKSRGNKRKKSSGQLSLL